MLDFDSLLNFFYIVAFLAAMVLPAFQKQRREEARKRAEEQRRGEEVPTVEERDPSDVPAPVVRRKVVPAAAEVEEEAAEEPKNRTAADLPSPLPSGAMRELASDSAVGAAHFPQFEDGHAMGALGDEIALGSIGSLGNELGSEQSASSPLISASSGSVSATPIALKKGLGPMDREALRRAILWREVLDKPVSLRNRRAN